ncbi:hypothetical protein THARTR1_08362 [Trichoderma harzianum]|uniref:Uncharacterized protein n=1 Tax=Trichoderma harzianum TaxID=5544 RepID=A0A2K0TZ17_TRIHA|nr:hypothetical protein THARTR1_08362 [Trichoderma harzianum]
MMLDTDRAKNPTKYAVRFGIFPGRSDGRSCTSPTRSTERFREIRDESGGSLTGRDLASKLEKLSQRSGLHIDDYLTSQSSNSILNDGPQERDYIKAFDKLLIEEFWQGCLFGDMTMDELLGGNYFEIGDFQSNLRGPIDSLFSREKWDQSPFGVADVSTVSFRLDGKCLDMEVEWNVEVWDCLQPALQMATRLFCQDDPFFKAILDVGNRYKIPATADSNPQKAKSPNFKIELRRDNTEAIGYRHKVRPSATFNPVELTFKVLESRLKWRIASAHYDVESPIGKFDAETAFAVTRFNLSNPNSFISIDLAAEVIWQLLADQLSSSEKTMVSWMLAATMVHELCHAIIEATLIWIRHPREFGVSHPADLRFCKLLESDLYPSAPYYPDIEPYYANDSRKEIGEAFERHVLGHGPYPMTHLSFYKPMFLLYHSGLTSSFDQSEFYPRDSCEHEVPAPYAVGEQSFTFNSHSTVQKFFTQEFWNTTFKKYGSAALRSVPDMPQRVAWFSAVESTTFHSSLGDLAFGTAEFREWASRFILELEASGQKVIAQYIKALIYDAWKFPMLAKRFVEIAENWYHRGERLTAQASKTGMLAFEAGIFFLYKNRRLSSRNKRQEATAFYKQWRRLRSHKRIAPDETSISLDGMSVDQFISSIARGGNMYDDRIVKLLMEFSKFLHQELCIQEAMVAQLYELPIGFWKHYLEGIPGHQFIWRVRNNKIITQLTRLLRDLNGLQAHLPSWRNEWQAKMLSWLTSFRNISYLISKDAREMHANWREMLHTVPMLRKSKRRVWERWYFLAKRAMLNLKGDQLAKLEEFEQRYARDFDLNSYKIVLPSRSSEVQGVAEKWAGLLDNIVEFEQDEGKLMEELEREELHVLASTPAAADHATTRADMYRQGVDRQLASTSISWRYQLQEAQHFNKTHSNLKVGEPQITRALMEDHTAPFVSSGNKKKRNWDLYTTGFDIIKGPVPKKRPADSVQKIDSLSELMAEVNKDTNDNVFVPAGRTPQLMPRVVQIAGDILSELAESVQRDMDKMDIDDEVFKMQQSREMFASEIQKTMKGHRETLSKARECQVVAHELAQQERDKLAEMQHLGGE